MLITRKHEGEPNGDKNLRIRRDRHPQTQGNSPKTTPNHKPALRRASNPQLQRNQLRLTCFPTRATQRSPRQRDQLHKHQRRNPVHGKGRLHQTSPQTRDKKRGKKTSIRLNKGEYSHSSYQNAARLCSPRTPSAAHRPQTRQHRLILHFTEIKQ